MVYYLCLMSVAIFFGLFYYMAFQAIEQKNLR